MADAAAAAEAAAASKRDRRSGGRPRRGGSDGGATIAFVTGLLRVEAPLEAAAQFPEVRARAPHKMSR